MTAADDDRQGWQPLDALLYVVSLLAACAVVVGGVLVVLDARDDSSPASDSAGPVGDDEQPSVEDEDTYGDVLAAASATATALVNIDYRTPEASSQAVADTATGTFLDQYQASTQSLVKLVTQYKSVMSGEVVEAAVSTLDTDKATVLVATKGTVTNVDSGGDAQVRNFRLVVKLVRQDGVWLTNDLEFAG